METLEGQNSALQGQFVVATIEAIRDSTSSGSTGIQVILNGTILYTVNASVQYFLSDKKSDVKVKINSCSAYVPAGASWLPVGLKESNNNFRVSRELVDINYPTPAT